VEKSLPLQLTKGHQRGGQRLLQFVLRRTAK
jgi:hypothetical protein